MNFEKYFMDLVKSFSHIRDSNDELKLIVDSISNCEGKVIVSGLGKTGIIGKKFSATLSSLGIPSFFLHCTEAVHGDLGVIGSSDLLILISQSGNSPEIVSMMLALKSFNNNIVGITSNINSQLAKGADLTLNLGVLVECEMHKYAPTYSTTVLLAVLDFIALKSSEALTKGILDFSRNHPGGTLGKSLRESLREFLVDATQYVVSIGVSFQELSRIMGLSGFGCALIIDQGRIGIVTDGDLRRIINGSGKFDLFLVEDMINWNPIIISELNLDYVMREFDNSGVAFLLFKESETIYFLKKF